MPWLGEDEPLDDAEKRNTWAGTFWREWDGAADNRTRARHARTVGMCSVMVATASHSAFWPRSC